MAAFTFPVNPDPNDEVINPETGTKYIYLFPPGKWDVLLKDVSGDYVDVGGDTMTGPLELAMSDESTAGALQIKTSDNEDTNYFLKLRNADNSVFAGLDGVRQFNYNGKQIKLQPLGHEWLTLPETGNGASTTGLGLMIAGPAVNDASFSGTVLDCVFNGDVNTPTRIRYFGDVLGANDIVNKQYVDSNVASAEALSYEGGTIQLGGDGGEQNGSLIIKARTDTAGTGFLTVQDSDGTPAFIVGPSGRTETREDIFMVNTTTDDQRLYCIGTNDKNLTIGIGGQPQAGSDTPAIINKNLIMTFEGTTLQGSEILFNDLRNREQLVKIKPSLTHTSPYKMFVIQGLTTDDGANELLTAWCLPGSSTTNDQIYYYGQTNLDYAIQTKKSVQLLISQASNAFDPNNYYTKQAANDTFYAAAKDYRHDTNIRLGTSPLGVQSVNGGNCFIAILNDNQRAFAVGGQNTTGGYVRSYGKLEAYRPLEGAATNTAGFWGLAVYGNRPGSAGSSVRDETIMDCYYSGGTEGTSVNYYGKQASGTTNLATVAFVENAIANPPSGPFSVEGPLKITGTSVDNTNTGDTNACLNFSSTSSTSGAVICKSGYSSGTISIGIGNPVDVRDLNKNLCIRVGGASASARYAEYYGKIIDITYAPTQYTRNYMTNVGQLYDVTNDLRNSTLSATNGTGANPGTNYATIQQTALEIQNPFNGLYDGRGFTVLGRTMDQPTNASAMLFKIEHRDASGGADYIQYYGETSDDNALQTKESVLALIQSEGGTPDTFQTLNLSGNFNYTGSDQKITINQRIDFRTFNTLDQQSQYSAMYIEADGSNSNYGVVRFGGRTRYASGSQTYFEGDQHIQQNGHDLNFYKGTTISSSETLFKLDPVNEIVRVNGTIYGASNQGDYGLQIDGSAITTTQLWTTPNPATFAIKTCNGSTSGVHNVHVYGGDGNAYALRLSKSGSLSSSALESAIYAFCDTSGSVKVQAYTDWGNAYSNVDTLPDSTIVTLGVLKAKGILTSATYSSTGSYDAETDSDTLQSTQSAVSIPAQATFESPAGGGNGFTVLGTTDTNVTNTSAKILQTFHTPNAASEIWYYGDTSDNAALQTKQSVLSLMQAHANNWTNTNTFKSTVNLGNASNFVITESRGVLRNGPSAASNNDGLNNGAIQVIDTTGAVTSAMYEFGLYTTKKLVFHGTSATQDILLEGANLKGINIKHVNNNSQEILATFKHSGSTLNSPLDLKGYRISNLSNPTVGTDAANKTYVDNKVASVSVSGTEQTVGTFTLTLDGTGTTPSTKQTVNAHYRKIGHIVHIVAHNANINLTGYAGSSIRMTGLPFQPDDDIPVQIGHIHAVNFMVNNYHADDDQVAVVMYDSTYGSHFRIFAGQVTNESTYIPNQTGASMTISATYIAES